MRQSSYCLTSLTSGGTRAHQGHISIEHVPQLGQFIKAEFAQEFTDGCNARVIFHFKSCDGHAAFHCGPIDL